MTVLEIVLLIIGLGLCIGSFFVSEKLSSKDKDNLQKLTREQIEDIIKDKMADAKVEMEKYTFHCQESKMRQKMPF